jgi:hypothetical protein
MKSRFTLAIAIAAILFTLPAAANDGDTKAHHAREAKAASSEHEKDAKEAPAEGSQQNKMKVCNVEAGKKNLKGDERRSFMSSCLKG